MPVRPIIAIATAAAIFTTPEEIIGLSSTIDGRHSAAKHERSIGTIELELCRLKQLLASTPCLRRVVIPSQCASEHRQMIFSPRRDPQTNHLDNNAFAHDPC
jgi:hypothetical protein